MRGTSMPRPSSETEIWTREPLLDACSFILPVAFFPAATRSSWPSMPCVIALLTKCDRGSTTISASDLSIPTSPPSISNSTCFPSWRAAMRPERVATRSSISAQGTRRNLISVSSTVENWRCSAAIAVSVESLFDGGATESTALQLSRNRSRSSQIRFSIWLRLTSTEEARCAST